MNPLPGPTREERDKMVAWGDENRRQVHHSRDAGGGERYCGPAVSPLPDGKDIPALDICSWELGTGLAEDV
jgi:hypothetical protein